VALVAPLTMGRARGAQASELTARVQRDRVTFEAQIAAAEAGDRQRKSAWWRSVRRRRSDAGKSRTGSCR